MSFRAVLVALCGGFFLALAACGESSAPEPTATPKPLPTPVEFAQEPTGATKGDPSFEALPGAQAHFGELGGSIYQIEIPEDWNRRLVLYLHGFANFSPTLSVQQPSIREYLVDTGYAWGASSFSNNSLIPGTAADETAALWDHFVAQFGRPEYTYVTGHSMGGGGTQLAAERYPNRFDGGLSLCGIAGNTPELAYLGDFFVAAAYSTGATQADFDAQGGLLADSVVLPGLEDPDNLERLIEIATELSGGERPFAREGVLAQMSGNLRFAGTALGGGVYDNTDTVYTTGTAFDDAAIRIEGGQFLEQFTAGQDPTGELLLPLITLQPRAALLVRLGHRQLLRRLAEDTGTDDLLVQRTVQGFGHCSMLEAEWTRSLADLVLWVEEGLQPAGEDVLADDLLDLGNDFTLAPRIGSQAADEVPGASERLELSGNLTLDGQPFEGFLLDVVVKHEGLLSACSFTGFVNADEGHYSTLVAGAGEVGGCGAPGDELYLFAFLNGDFLTSQQIAVWPDEGSELTFGASFSTSDPDGVSLPTTTFRGALANAAGAALPPGTKLEAFVGETLCGRTSLPHVVMGATNPFEYFLIVAGPDAKAGCLEGAEITFLIDGEEVSQTASNDLEPDPHELDLSIS